MKKSIYKAHIIGSTQQVLAAVIIITFISDGQRNGVVSSLLYWFERVKLHCEWGSIHRLRDEV